MGSREQDSSNLPSNGTRNHPELSSTRKIETEEELRAVLALPDPLGALLSLEPSCIPFVVDLLQLEGHKALATDDYRKSCLRSLRVLVKKHHVLPPSLFLNDITREGTHPLLGGGFADIYKGSVRGQSVCLKVLRTYVERDQRKRNKVVAEFCQETVVWKQLKHSNVLPFLGVNTELFSPGFCLVSPWLENGDIISYLKEHPSHDRLKSIYEITSGLTYLHSLSPMIIHGDIKGANILVDNNLSCCLADFGLAAVAGDTQLMNATTSGTLKGSLRWMAPEMFNMSIGTPTSGTIIDKSPRDVYAYACTILEIMTGRIPFPELMDPAVMFQVIRGARPSRPTEGCWCPDNIWNLVELCWQEDPGERPRAVQIETYLKKLLRSDQEDIVFSPEPSETLDAELHAHDDWVITGHNNSQGHKSDSDSDESSFDTVTSFFRAHTEELQRACHLPDPNIDIGSMDAEHAWDLIYVANNELDETAWVALEALECLAKLHSYRVIQNLVVACKHRIAPFYQTRSERWDVLALKIQIQMAMVQLFELRFIDDLESLGSAWIDLHSIFLQMTADLEHAAGFFQIGFDADPQAGCFDICRRFYLYQRILAEQLLPLTSSPKYTQDVTKTLHPFERATPYLHPWIDYSEVQRKSIGLSLDFGYRHFKPVEVYRVGETLLIRDAPMDKLKEQATIHGLLSVTAIIDGMSQWPVEVQRQQHPISLQDLLSDVYDSLRRRIRPREYNALSKEDANEVAAAFYRRCDAYRAAFGDRRAEAEIADGLKRVDYLKGRSKLGWAIMENDNGRAVVRLTVEEGYIASY